MLLMLVLLPLLGAALALAVWRSLGEAVALWISVALSVLACLLALTVQSGPAGEIVLLSPWIESGTLSTELVLRLPEHLALAPALLFGLSAITQLLVIDGARLPTKSQLAQGERVRLSAGVGAFCAAALLFLMSGGLAQMAAGLTLSLLGGVLMAGTEYRTRAAGRLAQRILVTGFIAVLAFITGAGLLFGAADADLFDIVRAPDTRAALEAPVILFGQVWMVGELAGCAIALAAAALLGQVLLHGWLTDLGLSAGPASGFLLLGLPGLGLVLLCSFANLLAQGVAAEMLIAIGGVSAVALSAFACFQADFRRVVTLLSGATGGVVCGLVGLGAPELAVAHFIGQGICLALLLWGASRVLTLVGGDGDLGHLGGRKMTMPVTYGTMLIAAAGISGFGLPFAYAGSALGVGAFSSMAAALEAASVRSELCWAFLLAFGLGSVAIWRAMILCFQGGARDVAGRDKKPGLEPRLSRQVFSAIALAVVIYPSLWPAPGVAEAPLHLPVLCFALGLSFAALSCLWQRDRAEAIAGTVPGFWMAMASAGFIERLQDVLLIAPSGWLGRVPGFQFDTALIDTQLTRAATAFLPRINNGWTRLRRGPTGRYALTAAIAFLLISTVLAMVGA